MHRFVFIIMVAFTMICNSGDDHPIRYFIRQADSSDKKAIIDLYEKSQRYYKDRLLDGRVVIKPIVEFNLMPSIDEGFAFVVELLTDQKDDGKIIAFLIKHRPLARSYRHIIDQGLSAIDPTFRNEMLLTQLHSHLQSYIEEHFPDVLRIEATCHERSYENIAMFERSNFVLEGCKERSVCLSNGDLVDELLFVWWNKNFSHR